MRVTGVQGGVLTTAHCRLGQAVKSKGALLLASLTVPTYAERVMAPLLAYALSLARLVVGGSQGVLTQTGLYLVAFGHSWPH